MISQHYWACAVPLVSCGDTEHLPNAERRQHAVTRNKLYRGFSSRVVITVSTSRSRDVLTSRLGLVSRKIVNVSTIYVSCPRPVFGQIVQVTLTNRLLQTVLREMELLKLKPGQTSGLTYCPVTRERWPGDPVSTLRSRLWVWQWTA